MPEFTPLDAALVEVIDFARRHGVDVARLTPRDFGHQLTGPGQTHITYVTGDHVVSSFIDRYGHRRTAVGTIEWIHDESHEDRDPCVEYCVECRACRANPCECPDGTPNAYRDQAGQIRRRSDGAFIAMADITRETLERRRNLHLEFPGETAVEMYALYTLGLALLDQEAATNV